MKKTLLAMVALSLIGCGPKHTPRERYVNALNHKLDGNGQAYYDDLIALAHEQPDSRAGRRARATLQSGGMMMNVAVIGILAAIAIPNFLKFQARAKQSEAKSNLKAVFTALKAYYAEHGRYCTTFKECGFVLEPGTRFLYQMGEQEVVGGDLAESYPLLRMRARAVLAELDITPVAKKKRFLVAAVGNVDSDADLDVWTIDDENNLLNPQNDVE
ncbi:type IV pilin protein [Myxococcota bacterium]